MVAAVKAAVEAMKAAGLSRGGAERGHAEHRGGEQTGNENDLLQTQHDGDSGQRLRFFSRCPASKLSPVACALEEEIRLRRGNRTRNCRPSSRNPRNSEKYFSR